MGIVSRRGYTGTLLGKALMGIMKVIGVRRSLLRMHTSMRSGNNYLETFSTVIASNCIELRFSAVDSYFDAVEPFRDELPVVDWELQKVFPGCYSVMHEVKQRQQQVEHLLDQAARTIGSFGAAAARSRRPPI